MADEMEEYDGVEMTVESRRLAEEAERKQSGKPAPVEDDDDDVFGDDEDDDDISKYYVDSDVSEDEDDDDDDDDDLAVSAADHDDDDDVAPKRRDKAEEKPKSKAQKRIEELASKRREAEKEAFEAQMRNIELERRLEALEKGRQEAPAATAEVKPKPDPKDYSYGEVDNKYIDDLVEHKLSVERAKFQKEQGTSEAQRKQAETAEHYKKRLSIISAEGKKKFGDNYEKIVNTVDFPADVARDILDSDQGVDISFYLAKNIGKLREMTTMSGKERAKALGRLEERFSASASAGKKRTEAPSTPNRRGKPAAKRQSADEAKYGPDDQDAFDKALFS